MRFEHSGNMIGDEFAQLVKFAANFIVSYWSKKISRIIFRTLMINAQGIIGGSREVEMLFDLLRGLLIELVLLITKLHFETHQVVSLS